jgi:hypothetical protein
VYEKCIATAFVQRGWSPRTWEAECRRRADIQQCERIASQYRRWADAIAAKHKDQVTYDRKVE